MDTDQLPSLEQSMVYEALQVFAANMATDHNYAEDVARAYGASPGECVRVAEANAKLMPPR